MVELLERIGLAPELADVRAADLPVAEQQLVSIAKALSQDPVILILDEPSAILTDREIETMFTAVRAMRDSGVAVIYISHRLDELAQITDRVTVLRDGAVVASRPTSEFSVRDVAELMVGPRARDRLHGPALADRRAGARGSSTSAAGRSSRTSRSRCAPARSSRSTG